jgi:RNA polymerase sigma-70 factor (ECF subfamily)
VVDPGDADFSDDGQLVAALRAGDEAAFAWLLDCYDGPLRRAARSFVRTEADAAEVVQETWLGVIRGIDGFQGRSTVRTWVWQILLNQARSRGRREARSVPFSAADQWAGDGYDGAFPVGAFRDGTDDWAGHWVTSPRAWSPAARAEDRELLACIGEALDALPDAQRTVMVLRDVQGWRADEVCDVLGLTATNQRVLLHRARARVRAALADYLERASV